ncbi:MAG: hypothetical protein ACOC2L_04630 [Candidatus Sumerlaeota bacterium]
MLGIEAIICYDAPSISHEGEIFVMGAVNMDDRHLSSGLVGLDRMFGGVLAGDNIVWQVDTLQDFRPLVMPFCRQAARIGRPLIYFRFGQHPPLVEPETEGVTTVELDVTGGFEAFLFKVHSVIGDTGRGAYYLFDNLTELVHHWFSDQMLANFFMLTCPYLYDLETVTYFPILRNRHSSRATAPITETTQLFLDIHRYKEKLYIRPIKVQHRIPPRCTCSTPGRRATSSFLSPRAY